MFKHDVISLVTDTGTNLDARFRPDVRVNPQGSIYLGRLFVTLVIADAIDRGVDLQIGMPNLKVRLTVAGKPRIDFPEDVRASDQKRFAQYFSANSASRELITKLAFALPEVAATVETVERARDAARSAA